MQMDVSVHIVFVNAETLINTLTGRLMCMVCFSTPNNMYD